MEPIDVIVTAGYSEGKPDLLAEYTGSPRKALAPLAGKPMVWHVVHALRAAPSIRDIIVMGIAPEEGVDLGTPVTFVRNQLGLLDNVYAGLDTVLRQHPDAIMTLVASGDIPLLTSDMVEWFVATCRQSEHDVYYSVVPKAVMETAFPTSKRSYIRFREGPHCGGDLFMVRLAAAHRSESLVRAALDRRKSAWRQALLMGVGTLLKLAVGRLSLPDAERVATRIFQVRGRAVVAPYAAIGMDVDKPFQYDIVRQRMG
ncbi:MAG: nucleotidyltransferase family protein [Anaerolineae bacterium]|uniref:nucleotidyltransferase family protein n=1 Tax=Candidatus Amarolinea dominans TaxID=3140696 RepID=UPI0031362472|nr:nucleotidyltransferase family protein [Anaerolineae bacterium]